jgi:CheY-like chemotaxis protein
MTCKQILLIEDERDLRETLKLLLELEGFHVATARNGREGLDLLDDRTPPCLIVLDMMMPVMSGWEFLETIKRERRALLENTALLVITAVADIGQSPSDLGCRVLKKPFEVEPFLQFARQHCC